VLTLASVGMWKQLWQWTLLLLKAKQVSGFFITS